LMRLSTSLIGGLLALNCLFAWAEPDPEPNAAHYAQAKALAQSAMIIDTHIDVPIRLYESWEDVSQATADGDFDYPRAKEGGLNLSFMSIYTPAEMEAEGGSYQLANVLIDSMEALVGRAPDKFIIVRNPSE